MKLANKITAKIAGRALWLAGKPLLVWEITSIAPACLAVPLSSSNCSLDR